MKPRSAGTSWARLSLTAMCCLCTLPCSAQIVPDGGTLRQQAEQLRPSAVPSLQNSVPAMVVTPALAESGPSVTATQFLFSNNTLLDDVALQNAVKPWLGLRVSLVELNRASVAVTEAYRRAGWLARAELPPQDITEGVVRIQIVEARFAGAVVEGEAPLRISPARALAMVEAALSTGSALNLTALDRAVLLINDWPGVRGTSSLRPGIREGHTQAVLSLTDTTPWNASATLDNAGARATGATRLVGQAALNSPMGWGDLANLQYMHTRGTDYARLAYSLPVGAAGWRVGASASALKYELVAPEFAALEAQGPSQTVGLEATVPLLRSRTGNVIFQATADTKRFRNEAVGSVSSRYRVNAVSATLSGNHIGNSWDVPASATGSVQFTAGRVDLTNSPNEAADAAAAQTAGVFKKIRLNASHHQGLTEATSVLVSAQAQWANKNLDGSEKFYLGGVNGVRAYPSNEAGGSRGHLLTVEVQHRAAPEGLYPFTLATFYDAGRTTVNVLNNYAGAPLLNSYVLQGAGVWWATTLPPAWGQTQLRLTWAQRIRSNPAANPGGLDQDGSKSRNRFWLSAGVAF
jgi:hemolysin activation/secretion protein